MKTFRFDRMVKRAQDEFVERVGLHNPMTSNIYLALLAACLMTPPQKPRKVLKKWTDEGLKLIAAWDVRKCMKLAELFPSCLPAAYHKRHPVCSYDEEGNWVLAFNS